MNRKTEGLLVATLWVAFAFWTAVFGTQLQIDLTVILGLFVLMLFVLAEYRND